MTSSRPPDPGPALRRLRRTHVLAQLGDGAFYVTSAAYLVRLGWSPARVGVLLGLCWGVGALLSRRVGRVADRHGLVGTSAATIGCCAVGLLGLSVLDASALVAAAFLVYAVGQSAWGGLRAALVQVAADPASAVAERARLQSVGNGAVAVGAAVGGLSLSVGSVLALRGVMAVDAVLYVAAAVLVARGLRTVAPPPTDVSARSAADRPTLRQLVATAAASALYLYMPMLSVALPLMVTAATGVPTWTIAACFLANTVGVMALQRRAAARVSTERRARHAVLAGGLLLAASSALLWTSLHGPGTSSGLVVLGLGLGLLTQVLGEVRFAAGAWDLGYRLAGPDGTAAWQATYGTAIPVARCVGPAILAPLATVQAGWIVPALLFLAGAAAMVAVTFARPVPVHPRSAA